MCLRAGAVDAQSGIGEAGHDFSEQSDGNAQCGNNAGWCVGQQEGAQDQHQQSADSH